MGSGHASELPKVGCKAGVLSRVMTRRARRVVAASASAEMPGFIKPQLATLKAKAPSGDQWLHEIKFDGYRVQVHLNKGKKRVFTRNGLDWTKRFSVIAGALDIPGQAILDGEVVVIHEGRTNFSELQAELAARATIRSDPSGSGRCSLSASS
jgi:ATP-dependent DNA ligase